MRWLGSGDVEFLGRIDFQIKLNGQRVEASEIETVIREIAGVRDALVQLKPLLGGSEHLAAYVLPANVSPDAVRSACSSRLPGYMVPSVVVSLDCWPLNSSGKVDRKRLPIAKQDVGTKQDSETVHNVVAHSSMEEVVLNLIKDKFGLRVAPSESLMQAGLNSLDAVRLSQSLQGSLAETAPRLPATLVFAHPTATSIAEYLSLKSELETNVQLATQQTHIHPELEINEISRGTTARSGTCRPSLSQTNVITTQPSGIDSVMVPLGSISKTVTAIGILRLVDQGLLSLNQPIHEILAWFRPTSVVGPPTVAVTNPITIAHLLLHQSGIGYGKATSFRTDLVDELYDLSSLSAQKMHKIVARHKEMRPLEAITHQIALMPLKFEPGSSFEYSMGHVVLGAAIEQVCQQVLGDALQDLVFGPLGIHSAQFHALPHLDVSELTPATTTFWGCEAKTSLELGDINVAMAVRDLHTLLSAVNIFDPNSQKLFPAGLLQIASEPQFDCTEVNEIAVTPIAVFNGPSANWALLGPLRNGRLATSGGCGVVSTIAKDGTLKIAIRDQLLVFWDLEETYELLSSVGSVSL